MRRVLVAVTVLCPMMTAAYACSTDTFASDGGTEAGVTQGEFCDAEAQYFHQCSFDDAACAQTDLKSCGAVFAAFSDRFASALTHCMEMAQLPCKGDLAKDLGSDCVSTQLTGYQNEGGAFAAFANDYCNACDRSNPACLGTFASATNAPGYVASLFDDGVIQKMDDCEKKLDGAAVTIQDASVSCLVQTYLCEYGAIGSATPGSTCADQ